MPTTAYRSNCIDFCYANVLQEGRAGPLFEKRFVNSVRVRLATGRPGDDRTHKPQMAHTSHNRLAVQAPLEGLRENVDSFIRHGDHLFKLLFQSAVSKEHSIADHIR
jgi:hypothetical protein